MIPMIIKRCLVHQIKIYPHQLGTVLNQYEKYKIPDDVVAHLDPLDLENYVKGLYLSGQEMSRDWTDGFEILKTLGFAEKKRTEGHRAFLQLEYS